MLRYFCVAAVALAAGAASAQQEIKRMPWPVENPTATVVYPDGVPDYAHATGADGHLVVRVGEPVEDRVQRRVTVLPAASGG